jgi:adenine-specific DNA-methyltransferase
VQFHPVPRQIFRVIRRFVYHGNEHKGLFTMLRDQTTSVIESTGHKEESAHSTESSSIPQVQDNESLLSLARKGVPPELLRENRTADLSITFPSTRFYGSKRRQLGWLHDELSRLTGTTALDAFGGTGAVSYLLDKLGFHTTYNDIFEFNTISARAIFSKTTLQFDEDALRDLLSNVEPRYGFIAATFEGMYFTTDENMWLDGFMSRVADQAPEIKDLVLYCLFQACLKKRPFNLFHRANLDLRQSNVPVQFGNRTTWARSFSEHILSTYVETKKAHWSANNSIHVNESRCAKAISPGFDLVYVDPPYFKRTKRNTDTYLQRYHFLEGLARYDDWPQLIDSNSPQKVIKGPYRNEWADKRDMLKNIREMIDIHKGAKFLLSYVSGEEPAERDLFDLFAEKFDRVRLSRRPFNKVLSTKKSFEILLIGQ